MPGYTVTGLRLNWRVMPRLILDAGGDNLADKHYELDAGFPSAGRTWYANLRYEI